MVRGGLSGKLGLLFAALSGVGAASIVGELLRAMPQAAAIAEQNPMLLVAAPIPVGAVVAIAQIFWLRSLTARSIPAAPSATPARTLVPPPDDGQGGGNKPPRWRPVIRN